MVEGRDLSGTTPHLLMVGGRAAIVEKALANGFTVSYIGHEASNPLSDDLVARCAWVRYTAIDQVSWCLALARQRHAETSLTAVITFTELGLETAAVIADALGVPGPQLWPTAVTKYKDRMREVLASHPTLSLPWRRVTSTADIVDFYDRYGPKIIVKPVAGYGAMGVRQIRTEAELKAALVDPALLGEGNYLVEKLADNSEVYTVETLSASGRHAVLAFSYAKMVDYPRSVHNYSMTPPPSDFDVLESAVVDTVREFLTAVGLTRGVAHTEIRVGENGHPVVIESHTRVAGARLWRGIELTTGVNQIDLALMGLIRDDIELPHLPPSDSVAVYLSLLAPEGRVLRTADPAALREIDGVLEVVADIEPGQELPKVTDMTLEAGFVFLHAPDHRTANATLDAIRRTYWIEYDDGRIWNPSF
ncbi:ATP-grasp domain-containing protein [Streptomyces mirabilis]|uniref:ATP-grasp domain-containing protein n=1 Tax=Streptomyces mirabilis TaxID=68239 RepID=UPI0036E90EC9